MVGYFSVLYLKKAFILLKNRIKNHSNPSMTSTQTQRKCAHREISIKHTRILRFNVYGTERKRVETSTIYDFRTAHSYLFRWKIIF